MSEAKFTYQPSLWVPFRDKEVIDRVAAIKREDMEKHPNPDYKIKVVPRNCFGVAGDAISC